MARHGVLPEEQERAQPFEVDLDLEIDASGAVASDDVADAVDYGTVLGVVTQILLTERFRLLESLAARVVEAIMVDDRVHAVAVTIRKLRPPVAVDLASAGVRLERRRLP